MLGARGRARSHLDDGLDEFAPRVEPQGKLPHPGVFVQLVCAPHTERSLYAVSSLRPAPAPGGTSPSPTRPPTLRATARPPPSGASSESSRPPPTLNGTQQRQRRRRGSSLAGPASLVK